MGKIVNKILIIIIIALGFSTLLFSQEQIDSLEKKLKNNLSYGKKAQLLGDIIDYYNETNPQKSEKFIVQLEEQSKNANDYENIIQAILFRSVAKGQMGELELSNQYAFEALELAKEYDKKHFFARIFLSLGLNYLRLGEHDKSMLNLLKASRYAKADKMDNTLASINVSLGILHRELKEYSEAIKYYKLAEISFKKDNDYQGLSMVNSNLSSIYLETNNNNKALEFIDIAIKYNDFRKNLNSQAIAFNNKGAILFNLGRHKEAIEFIKKSIAIKEEYQNKIGVAVSKLALGEIYFEMKNYALAEENINQSIPVFKNSNILNYLLTAYSKMEQIFSIRGDYKTAYNYSKLVQSISDTLYNETKQKAIAELKAKYNLAEKERVNQLLMRESEKQDHVITIIIIILVSFVIMAVLFFWRYKTAKKANAMLSENKIIIENKNNELELLNIELVKSNANLNELVIIKDKFFSIIAHDLKSPISTLNMLIETINNDYEEMDESDRREFLGIIAQSSKNTFNLVQNLLTWARSQQGRIEFNNDIVEIGKLAQQTIDQLKPTADVKNIRLVNLIDHKLKISADVNLISTIIRNIVSNGIKYTKDGGKIELSVVENYNEFQFSIQDTGVGMKQEQINNLFKIDSTSSTPGTNHEIGTGLGLVLCKEFVEKHGGKIWAESELGKGSTFYFTIKKIDILNSIQ